MTDKQITQPASEIDFFLLIMVRLHAYTVKLAQSIRFLLMVQEIGVQYLSVPFALVKIECTKIPLDMELINSIVQTPRGYIG